MPDTRTIDLNSDLGESFGAYQIGADDEIFDLISSASVACGFHGGDPRVMERTINAAKTHGVAVGAHPGFLDLVGFGRRAIAATPDEIRTDILYQVGALDAFCRVAGVPLQHVKPHGALYNVAVTRPEIAGAIAWAVRAYDPTLMLLAQPGTALAAAGEATGLPIAREGFADRAYNADGTLVSRQSTGAMITDPGEAADRMLRLVTEGKLRTLNGKDLTLKVASICVHSDTPGAVAILRAVRGRLEEAGITIGPLRVNAPR